MATVKIAWGLDATGRLVHVTESQTGLACCRCICAACGSNLEGVNVFNQGIRRPHFRHYELPATGICGIRTAVLALGDAIRKAKRIMLPRLDDGPYRVTATEVGVAGTHFEDEFSAILTLEDGRRLLVRLVASGVPHPSSDAASDVAIVDLQVSDAGIAAEDPDGLRRMLAQGLIKAKWQRYWLPSQPTVRAAVPAAVAGRPSRPGASPTRLEWHTVDPSNHNAAPAIANRAGIWRKWDWAKIYRDALELQKSHSVDAALALIKERHGFMQSNNVVDDFLVACRVLRLAPTVG